MAGRPRRRQATPALPRRCRTHGLPLSDLYGCHTCCPDCGRHIAARWLSDHLNGRDYRPSARNCRRNREAVLLFVGEAPYKPPREIDLGCRS